MKDGYQVLGRFIEIIDERNKALAITSLLGVSITKQFIPSIANIVGTDLTSYKIVRMGQFAYGPVTSRNGEKVSIALLKEPDCIISSSYTVFRVVKDDELDPDYLMLWFSRPEFDRYARYMSHGSVREIFGWEEMCKVELPVPTLDRQKAIVKAYQTITDRIELKRKINDNLLVQAKAYFQNIFTIIGSKIVCPENCVLRKVGDYCSENNANLSQSSFETIIYLDTGSITENFIDKLQEFNCATDEIPSRAKRMVEEGDIVYSTVRPNLKHFGLMQNPPKNLIVSTGFAVLHNTNPKVSNELLYMWLTSDTILEFLQSIAENSVSTYPSLNVSDLLDVKIAIPNDTTTLQDANVFLKAVFTAIYENNRQIKLLSDGLPILIPRLMSDR